MFKQVFDLSMFFHFLKDIFAAISDYFNY